MRPILTALVLAILSVIPSLAAEDPNPPGRIGGRIAIGATPDYIQDWQKPGTADPPVVPVVDRFSIGDTAYVAFLVTGLLPDAKGEGNVSVDLRLLKPDGTAMFDEQGIARITGPLNETPCWYMADPAIDIVFEPGDPVGEYELVAVFHDHNSKKGALAEVRLHIVEKKEDRGPGRQP